MNFYSIYKWIQPKIRENTEVKKVNDISNSHTHDLGLTDPVWVAVGFGIHTKNRSVNWRGMEVKEYT